MNTTAHSSAVMSSAAVAAAANSASNPRRDYAAEMRELLAQSETNRAKAAELDSSIALLGSDNRMEKAVEQAMQQVCTPHM